MVAGGPERPLRPGSTNHRHKQQLLPQRQYNCFCTQPPPQPPSPWSWVPTCQISSYFIFLLLVIVYCLLFTIRYRHPLRRLRYAVTRAPLSRCLRGGSGRLRTGPGRMRQSKLTIVHPCAHRWLVRQWALLHGLARAGPHWVPGGQELDRVKAIAHGSVLNGA